MPDYYAEEDFEKEFPNSDVCLDFLFKKFFGDRPICPGCKSKQKFHRVKKRKCYSCQNCAKQIHPMNGTIFQGTRIGLKKWFKIIFEFHITRNGISAKEVQRRLKLYYKTAWRMCHKIRELMEEDGDFLMTGIIEVDETLIGGKKKKRSDGTYMDNKTCVFGLVERGGRVKTVAVENRQKKTLIPIIKELVEEGATIFSDDYGPYRCLSKKGFDHDIVHHTKYRWAYGEVNTNSIEGYWSLIKRSILGTHVKIYRKWMQNYMNEFSFRYNRRKKGHMIFHDMLANIKSTSPTYVFQQTPDTS